MSSKATKMTDTDFFEHVILENSIVYSPTKKIFLRILIDTDTQEITDLHGITEAPKIIVLPGTI